MVNETWRELGEHAIIMRQLEKAHGALEKEVNKWKMNILEKVEALERQSTVALRIEDAFRSAQQTMDWVASKLEDLSVGLALLMVGNLPAELFPPTQLRAVLKEIMMSLQAGWDLTPSLQKGDLWRIYQEERVVSAATQSGVRLFIHLPIIEVTKSFQLFKIFVLPLFSAAGNFGLHYAGNFGLHYAPVPEFLAVGEDRQIFMELTEAEVRSCQGRAGSVCPPSKAIYRKNFKKFCAMALFLQDPAKEKEECDQIMVEWRGPEALYLGNRRWAVSLERPKSLVMSCLDQAGASKLPKAEIPAIGIVEIPAGILLQSLFYPRPPYKWYH